MWVPKRVASKSRDNVRLTFDIKDWEQALQEKALLRGPAGLSEVQPHPKQTKRNLWKQLRSLQTPYVKTLDSVLVACFGVIKCAGRVSSHKARYSIKLRVQCFNKVIGLFMLECPLAN